MQDLCQRIRNFLFGDPRRQLALLQKGRADYYQIVACIDVIEDSEMAIKHFCREKTMGPIEEACLELFGVMQAMFVQQDATTHLSARLGQKTPFGV